MSTVIIISFENTMPKSWQFNRLHTQAAKDKTLLILPSHSGTRKHYSQSCMGPQFEKHPLFPPCQLLCPETHVRMTLLCMITFPCCFFSPAQFSLLLAASFCCLSNSSPVAVNNLSPLLYCLSNIYRLLFSFSPSHTSFFVALPLDSL